MGFFINPDIKIHPLAKEAIDFQLLNSKTDSVAVNAFIRLTTGNIEQVQTLADEYEKADIENNYILPTFPYRFLKQMVVLTDYCKNNNIEFTGSAEVTKNVYKLNSELSFADRRALQDKLISSLTLDYITACEYWTLVYEKSDELTFSAGRIFDAFYSRNWNKIIGDKKQLDLYLKKSKLFEDLGIVGVSNSYLKKFINADSVTLKTLRQNVSSDNDVNIQTTRALKIASEKHLFKIAKGKFNGGNYDTVVNDFEKELPKLIQLKIDSDEREHQISKLLSEINYDQIGSALSLIENYGFKRRWEKYTFMQRDFGFFMGDFDKPEIRKEFVDYYNGHSERELYAYYLTKAGIDYKNADQTLNYDKMYELLKYDVVNAFVGGGGGTRENEVYSLIKLLELEFKTTLGFPRKLCNSDNMNKCDSAERVKEWLLFLREKDLLKLTHNEPVSFNYF